MATAMKITCGGCLIGFPLGTGIHSMKSGCFHERVTCGGCGARIQRADAGKDDSDGVFCKGCKGSNGRSQRPMNLKAGIAKAKELGHDVEHDPPHALSSMDRYTCKGCGAAVLGNGSTAYGSALQRACAQQSASATK